MMVKFYTVTELVIRLAEAKGGGTLERLMSEIQHCQLLILDEWGYIPVDKDGSQLLFRVIADSYESRSLVITTNLEFSTCCVSRDCPESGTMTCVIHMPACY
jgi:DNA replication protein DnaC